MTRLLTNFRRRVLPKLVSTRGVLRVSAMVAAAFVLLATAFAQDFSLQMTEFNPIAVDPGGNTSSNLTISPLNGFTGSVNLSCQVTSLQTGITLPVCQVSPLTVTPPTGASVTITTPGVVPPGGYTVTITGTGGSTTQTASRTMTVLSVTPSFTITVANVVSPSSVPAGGQGVANISLNPINGYDGTVTLFCSAVTPVTVAPPVCNFNPQTVTLSSSGPVPVTLTLTTIGPTTPTTTTSVAVHRTFYALWLPLPLLAVFGVAAGGRRKRAWSLLALFVMSALVLLIPACSTTTTPQVVNDVNIVTPNGTYTFTVAGVDATGASATNVSSGAASSITLTVTASPTT